MGLKIILVAVFSWGLLGKALPAEIWLASALATAGIVLLNVSGRGQKSVHAAYSIGMGVLAAAAFGLFDVGVQVFSAGWGVGRFLPMMFLCSSAMSLLFIPLFKAPLTQIPRTAWPWLIGGCLLIALQAFCIVFTIATWGQAAAANVLYSTRGVWSIVLVWLLGRFTGTNEVTTGAGIWLRLLGATLLLGSVVLLLM
jgi:drug/metabolite transporter (DMT)-like permease